MVNYADRRTLPPANLTRAGARASLRRFAGTTPGIVVLIAVAIAICCAVAALVSAAALERRAAEADALLARSEPLAFAAQNLYAALSEADAAATSAYLSGGIQTPAMRERYQQAIAAASSALADVAAGATDLDSRTAVAGVAEQLATYTGLIESARINNIQNFTVGSAYLREGSTLMQSALLPGAEKILNRDLEALADGQRRVGSTPLVSVGLMALALAVIGVGSWIMLRRTNRQFNLGLVIAAGLVVTAMVWIVVATRLAAADIERSREESLAHFVHVANARILARQARTVEMLELIDRGDITAREADFTALIDNLHGELQAGPESAAGAVDEWLTSHQFQVDAYLAGDFATAIERAIGAADNGSAAKFSAVENTLRDEIDQTRATVRDHVGAAGRALTGAPAAMLVLLGCAVVATAVGMWPRLKEFL